MSLPISIADGREFLGQLVDYLRHPEVGTYGFTDTKIIPTAGCTSIWSRVTGKPSAPTIPIWTLRCAAAQPRKRWITATAEPTARNGRLYAQKLWATTKGQLHSTWPSDHCWHAGAATTSNSTRGRGKRSGAHRCQSLYRSICRIKANLTSSSATALSTPVGKILFRARGAELQATTSAGEYHPICTLETGRIIARPIRSGPFAPPGQHEETGRNNCEGFYDNVCKRTLRREALALIPVNTEDIKQSLGPATTVQPQGRGIPESGSQR